MTTYDWESLDWSAFAGLGAAMIGFIIVLSIILFAIFVVLYLLLAFGLYRIAIRKNVEYPWIAFIPGIQLWTLGGILKRLNIFGVEIPRPDIFLGIGPIAAGFIAQIPYVGWLATVAICIVEFAAFYYLFLMFKPKDTAVLWLILSIVLSFMAPIFIFSLRNAPEISDDFSSVVPAQFSEYVPPQGPTEFHVQPPENPSQETPNDKPEA